MQSKIEGKILYEYLNQNLDLNLYWNHKKQKILSIYKNPHVNNKQENNMYIEKIEIQNFKCFGKKAIFNIKPGNNAFVGDNGTGKTTVLEALNKVFKEANISIDDFHIGCKNNTKNNTREKNNRAKQMFIDVTICIQNSDVTPYASHYIFKSIDSLKFRIRLEAENIDGQDYDNVEYKLYAVYTDKDIPFGSDAVEYGKRPISKSNRVVCQVFFM